MNKQSDTLRTMPCSPVFFVRIAVCVYWHWYKGLDTRAMLPLLVAFRTIHIVEGQNPLCFITSLFVMCSQHSSRNPILKSQYAYIGIYSR